jgi:nitrogen regulatory protein A
MNVDQQLLSICESLMETIRCEFVGLAVYNQQGKELRWKYAIGNRNDKYKRIHVRYGKGIVGQVFRSGSMMIIPSFPDQIVGKATDYPIMLAEQLVSSIAVPVFFHKSPWGVLLSGNRTGRKIYNDKVIEEMQKATHRIEDVLEKCLN